MTIAQQSSAGFPVVTYVVTTIEGKVLALAKALVRKLAGKFSPRYEANVRIRYAGSVSGWIVRRPNENNAVDLLDLAPDAALDRRVAVALAVLVLGSEP